MFREERDIERGDNMTQIVKNSCFVKSLIITLRATLLVAPVLSFLSFVVK